MQDVDVVPYKFPCTQCGKCCSNVHLLTEGDFLNRGDGVCMYFDVAALLCSIYDNRPEICRVGFQYNKNYSNKYSWDQFVKLNLIACSQLNEYF